MARMRRKPNGADAPQAKGADAPARRLRERKTKGKRVPPIALADGALCMDAGALYA